MPTPKTSEIDNIVKMIQAGSKPVSNNFKISIRISQSGKEVALELEGTGEDIAEVAVECVHAAFHTSGLQ